MSVSIQGQEQELQGVEFLLFCFLFKNNRTKLANRLDIFEAQTLLTVTQTADKMRSIVIRL